MAILQNKMVQTWFWYHRTVLSGCRYQSWEWHHLNQDNETDTVVPKSGLNHYILQDRRHITYVPWFFGSFWGLYFLLSLFCEQNWPYLLNYYFVRLDWNFFESRFWAFGGTHQITAFKVVRSQRLMVRPECTLCTRVSSHCMVCPLNTDPDHVM